MSSSLGSPLSVLPASAPPPRASGDFRSQFEQNRDAEEPAAAAPAKATPTNAGSTPSANAAPPARDPRPRKPEPNRTNQNAVAPVAVPANPAATLPIRFQFAFGITPDEGTASDKPATQAAGGQAAPAIPEESPMPAAPPPGDLAFALKLKPETAETPATPAAKPAIAKPEAAAVVPATEQAAPAASTTEKESSGKAAILTESAGDKLAGGTATPAATAIAATQTQTAHQDPPRVEAPAPVRAPAAPEPRPTAHAPQEISLRVASDNGDDRKVEIRLMERGGEVRVAVRTPDETLARTMREDLGSLTGKLAQSGFATESWAPTRAGSSSLADHHNESANPESQGGDKQPSQQQRNFSQQQQQEQEDGKRPSWMEELDHSLNRSTVWQPR